MIMTRKALARQEETKLQMALRELKATKERYNQLSGERDDNERELLEVLSKNDKMKKEMSKLHSQYNHAIDDRDRLQLVVDSFDECRNEYICALNRITSLEQQLHRANNKISDLEELNTTVIASTNQSLFDELVAPGLDSASVNNLHPSVIIDLTRDDEPIKHPKSVRVIRCSNKKFKKYIKVKRYITKMKKQIKKHKFFINCMSLNRHRLQLIDQLKMYSLELDNVSLQYQTDTRAMQSEIDRLHESLTSITTKYEMAAKQSREQVLAIGRLVNSCKCDNDSSITLSNNSNFMRTSLNYQPEPAPSPLPMINTPPSTPNPPQTHIPTPSSPIINKKNNITLFSDEIGKDLSSYILNTNMEHSITNYCTPNLPYCKILDRIVNSNFNQDTTLIIFVGNRGNVNRKKFIDYFECLSKLNVNKIVLFALPLSKGLPQEELNIRSNLNVIMHNLTCQINGINYNKFHFIDTNRIVSNCLYTTKDSYYLSYYCKRQVAISLSYFISITAKNLAKQVASIEQHNIDISNNLASKLANNFDIPNKNYDMNVDMTCNLN
ncbi:uncharacterized protein LOC142975843 [Anticarsia gemmatalis]|uniref:uncharacterized protein LOC142975843 n=1 Tax=Anticarsia gemmatalis TaxID=129554 RepID=UPI003F760371